jgi:hypothetical protein
MRMCLYRKCWLGWINFWIHSSQNVTNLLQVLERIKEIAHSHPPVDNKASRFGNPAFREFYDHIDQVSLSLFKTTHHFWAVVQYAHNLNSRSGIGRTAWLAWCTRRETCRTIHLSHWIMGKSNADWLRKWHGTQLPLLAVGLVSSSTYPNLSILLAPT